MLKFKKIFLIILPISFLMLSTGVVFAASSAPAQTMQVNPPFSAPGGIRWNSAMDSFEVFNAAGVSYIASGKYVSVTGNIAETQTDVSYSLADGNKTYYIMQDISYSDESGAFNPAWRTAKVNIGSNGVVDGRGFYLRGFPLRQAAEGQATALFYNNSGIIRNLNITDFVCKAANDGAFLCFNNSGMIKNCAAYAAEILDSTKVGESAVFVFENSESGIIMDCVNDISVSGDRAVSGIAANTYGTIQNCVNNGNIKCRAEAGGIACSAYNGTIQNCINNGNLISGGNAGGIVSYVEEGLIQNCLNSGDIICQTASYGNAGGIVARSVNDITLIDCKNTGKIKNSQVDEGYAGGIISLFENGSIKDCVNSGEVIGVYNIGGIAAFTDGAGTKEIIGCANSAGISNMAGGYDCNIGGVLGYSENAVIMLRSCVNSGDVSDTIVTSHYSGGGIAGYYDKGILRDCHNSGKVTGYAFIGGIAGISGGAVNEITNCSNSGSVSILYAAGDNYSYAGGIIGVFHYGMIRDCNNSGGVTGYNCTGGIGGYAGKSVQEISNCTNSGDVSNPAAAGTKYIGGILCYSDSTLIKINGCVNNGDLMCAEANNCISGGIVSYFNFSAASVTVSDCVNNGLVLGYYAGGIVGYVSSVTVSYTITGNTNNGDIAGSAGTYGIMGSPSAISITYLTQRNNVNNGILLGATVYQLFR